jgi:condensin complex subunit 2
MSLLKEGDGVNFQRASCTLDGCVKIYTNRVDSVATETINLLSGLADSKSKDKDDDDNANIEDEDDDQDDDGTRKRSKKRVG